MAHNWKPYLQAAVIGGAGLAALGCIYMKYKIRSSPRARSGKNYKFSDPFHMYIKNHNVEDQVLAELRALSIEHKFGMMTTAVDGSKQLTFFVRALKAKKCLDVGVFTGCSAFAIALGLPDDGKVIACDVSEEFTSVGKPFWEKGGVSGKIDLRLQPATQTLQELIDNGEAGTFDLMFIDADKENYGVYYEMGVELLRKGGLIVVDNALWSGRVADPAETDPETVSIRELNKKMRDDPRVDFLLLDIADGVGVAQKL